MVDHLKEAKFYAHAADGLGVSPGLAQLNAQLATAHALIAQAEASRAQVALIERLLERLPPPAETGSECQVRLRQEDRDGV